MRYVFLALWMLFFSVPPAMAQVSISIGVPGVNIGINLPVYPELVQVPGYPVYYAPQMNSNYFFYDGMYWVYQEDNWYASSWYNGPWGWVDPEGVPLFVLRIPVRYYRQAPVYFGGWRQDAPPRWGEHWGNNWEQRRSGWDRWNRNAAPAPAPLPVYQRQYSGDRYPRAEQQHELRNQNYRYQPREAVTRQHYQAPAQRRNDDQERSRPLATPTPQQGPRTQDSNRQQRQGAGQREQQNAPAVPRPQPAQRGSGDQDRSPPLVTPTPQKGPTAQELRPPPRPGAGQREQQRPESAQGAVPQGKEAPPASARAQGPNKDQDKGDERAQERRQERNR